MRGILDFEEHRKLDLIIFSGAASLTISFVLGALGILAVSTSASSALLLATFLLGAVGSTTPGRGVLAHNGLRRREIDLLMRMIQVRTNEPWEM